MSDRANSPADPAPGVSRAPARPAPTRLRIGPLLRPYWRPLALALVAVIGETLGDILEPWPVKIVVDNVFGRKRFRRGCLRLRYRTRTVMRWSWR